MRALALGRAAWGRRLQAAALGFLAALAGCSDSGDQPPKDGGPKATPGHHASKDKAAKSSIGEGTPKETKPGSRGAERVPEEARAKATDAQQGPKETGAKPGIGQQAPEDTEPRSGTAEEARQERVVDLGGGVKMTFVLIPAGTFTMGSTQAQIKAVAARWSEPGHFPFGDEMPAHKATIARAFWMGKHEVTVGQFRRFAEATHYKTASERGTDIKGALVLADGLEKFHEDASWRNPYFKQGDEHPVVCVTWNDARAFVDWLNDADKARPNGSSFRLPTEPEWEYACRAGTTSWYQWGDNPDKAKGWCNAADLIVKKLFPNWSVFSWDDGFAYTAPVGSFRANAFGLHDMHGNVWEWCDGVYQLYEGAEQTDEDPRIGDCRVLRGGSWRDVARDLRSSCRLVSNADFASTNFVGFRLVMAPGPR